MARRGGLSQERIIIRDSHVPAAAVECLVRFISADCGIPRSQDFTKGKPVVDILDPRPNANDAFYV